MTPLITKLDGLRDALVDLFAPGSAHKDGCLYHDPHIKPHGPCTCGALGRYNSYKATVHAFVRDYPALRDQIVKMQEALEPFAEEADGVGAAWTDGTLMTAIAFTAGELRRARAALPSTQDEKK